MARLDQEIIIDDLPEGNPFEPVPEGWYNVTIVEAGLKATKAGNGQYIALRMDITGPTYQGRVLWTNVNILNPSAQAEEIGRQQLRSIAEAIGVSRISDTDQLVGGSLQVKVAVKKDEQYGDKNEVRGYKAIPGGQPVRSMPPNQAATTQTAAKASATPPWAKR